jgi:site-specific DNA-methyltransferase (cytosine-N4-specific)
MATSTGPGDQATPRLPFAGEFSPGQIDLKNVLDLAATTDGDRAELVAEIASRYFSEAAESLANDPEARLEMQRKRAGNVAIGLANYGLYDSSSQGLTPLGEELRTERDDASRMKRFARHILTELNGVAVLEAVRALQRRGVRPSKTALADELRRRGFTTLPQATTHHLIMLNWLAEAGVVRDGRNRVIDDAVLREIIGGATEEIHQISAMTAGQRAFLDALVHLSRGRAAPVRVAHVEEVAIERHGNVLGNDDSRRRRIRDPLATAGYITLPATKGRGGKSGNVTPSDKLLALDPELLTGHVETGLPSDLLEHMDTPLDQIYADLSSSDTHVKGLALELLAVNMAIDLGLTPIALRLRAAQAGGSEVDLIAESIGMWTTRFVFQCKNTASVRGNVVLREHGLADLLKAQATIVVATGKFTADAAKVRDAVAADTAKQMVLVDGSVLQRYRTNGATSLAAYFKAQAERTSTLKRGQTTRLGDLEVTE